MLGNEIDLLKNYPKSKRDFSGRLQAKSEAVRVVARQFGREFFDGSRDYGYGGLSYHPRFWQPVMPTFIEYFNLTANLTVLDVGCAKGFMLNDLLLAVEGINVTGVDISQYAISNSKEEVRDKLQVANAIELPFEDKSLDVVFSINTIHNLNREECALALQEMERVSKGRSFITVDAYRNDEERTRMEAWNLTAKTMMHVDKWKEFFKEVGYTGDFYWFIP